MAVRARGTKKSCVIKEMFAPFKLPNETLCSIMGRLLTAINQGLSKDTHNNAAVKCYQTYVYDLPDGNEVGKYLAIDLGGANFRILLITLNKGKEFKMDSRIYVFPEEKLDSTADEENTRQLIGHTSTPSMPDKLPSSDDGQIARKTLGNLFDIRVHQVCLISCLALLTGKPLGNLFDTSHRFHGTKVSYELPNLCQANARQFIRHFFDFIVSCLALFKEELKLDGEKLPLGFCFGFPLEQKSLSSGILTRWAKRFNVKGTVGKDIGELFRQALQKAKIEIGPIALLNDTTGCLLSCAWKEPTCRIGVIIGTGTNACYYEKKANIELYNGNPSKPGMVINTEWGNFGHDGSLNDILTEFDRLLDSTSLRPGVETFEKMVSVMYACELIRLSILKCVDTKYLFGGEVVDRLKNKGSFLPEYLYDIESDEADLRKTMAVFEGLGINQVTAQDCVNVRYITEMICKRSAHLLSAAISTLINKIGMTPITVGIDGGMYRNHPKYQEMVKEKVRCMINPNIQFELVLSEDGSGRGAALVVACIK